MTALAVLVGRVVVGLHLVVLLVLLFAFLFVAFGLFLVGEPGTVVSVALLLLVCFAVVRILLAAVVGPVALLGVGRVAWSLAWFGALASVGSALAFVLGDAGAALTESTREALTFWVFGAFLLPCFAVCLGLRAHARQGARRAAGAP